MSGTVANKRQKVHETNTKIHQKANPKTIQNRHAKRYRKILLKHQKKSKVEPERIPQVDKIHAKNNTWK